MRFSLPPRMLGVCVLILASCSEAIPTKSLWEPAVTIPILKITTSTELGSIVNVRPFLGTGVGITRATYKVTDLECEPQVSESDLALQAAANSSEADADLEVQRKKKLKQERKSKKPDADSFAEAERNAAMARVILAAATAMANPTGTDLKTSVKDSTDAELRLITAPNSGFSWQAQQAAKAIAGPKQIDSWVANQCPDHLVKLKETAVSQRSISFIFLVTAKEKVEATGEEIDQEDYNLALAYVWGWFNNAIQFGLGWDAGEKDPDQKDRGFFMLGGGLKF